MRTSTPDTPLKATPQLERLLAKLRAHLGRLAALQGFGVFLAVLSAWLVFSFVADWALHVPRGVRWFHLAVCVAAPLVALWRLGLRPWFARPSRSGLALLIERADPSAHELYVSAVQLQQAAPPDAHPELIERVMRDAELRAARADLAGVLDPAVPRKLFGLGLAAALGLLFAARTWPEHAEIFVARLLGADRPWPQLTTLELALGAGLEKVELERTATGVLARLPRGSDAPIVVRAVGVRPREVRLHLDSSSSFQLTPSPDGAFRTVLRSLDRDLTLHATGGDDRDREPTLTLIVLEPPDVAALAVRIEPPAYSGLPARVESAGDVEVLAGSRVAITLQPSPADAVGVVKLLPADQTIELAPMPMATSEASAEPPPAGLGFELVATQSFRYRIELRDSQGLTNPDPGLFAVQVRRDERPTAEWLAPARNEIESLARGVVRLLARVDDDFGVAGAQWRARRVGGDREPQWSAIELRELPADASAAASRQARLVGTRVELAGLEPGSRELEPGDQFELELRVYDARPGPADGEFDEAGVGTATTLRVRVVSEDDFLRRLQDRLGRVRSQVSDLEELARERVRRTSELLRTLESESGETSDAAGLVSGQRRVQGDLDSLARELASAVESVLYARLDEAAEGALVDLDGRLAQGTARTFPVEAWRGFAEAVRAGQVSAPGVPGQLAGLLQRALTLSSEHSPRAVSELERAAATVDASAASTALAQALASQQAVHAGLNELLEQLADWDNFQAVLTLTRDILTRQKSVRDRTKAASGADPRSDRR